jgi:hypothetical protein
MQVQRRELFTTIRTEGAILPSDLLQRVAAGDKDIGGLEPADYHLVQGEPLNETIARSWNRLVGAWASFTDARDKLPAGDPGTSITRERWLLILFDELGYGRLQPARAVDIGGKSYAVSHAWGEHVPIHLVGCNVPLDRRTQGVAGASTMSPHGLMQELLNRSEERLWGFVSNGLGLRILRDHSSLTRQAYVEFDLASMMDGDIYADFVVLWLVCHQSRVEGEPHVCWLERWSQEAAEQGTRALDGLRSGVETAISTLGSGFLAERSNGALRDSLRTGELDKQELYREVLRLVYRLLFLFVAEDRGLLLDPGASSGAVDRYRRFYSTQRLRKLAERRRGSRHGDLYAGLRLVMDKLGNDEGCTKLGLPALGSYLWSPEAIPNLRAAELPNAALLDAVRALATLEERGTLRSVDYRNLGAEELGSVYESLLELQPDVHVDQGTFSLSTAAGNERKTTGSYYTPTSLISCLLDSALDPVLDEAAHEGEQAILALRVVDPACGSGHFLVAAAHRIAKRLASARTADEEPSPSATRTALRDVVGHCLFGVDVNPMAVELCKVSLWIEALEPGRPLSFLEAHIKCGNSLLGATAALVAGGIPDGAFKALDGDDKEVLKSLRKQNAAERAGQRTLEDAAIELIDALESKAEVLEAVDDGTMDGLHAKEELFRDLLASKEFERAKLTADAWCVAFVQRTEPHDPRITTGFVQRMAKGTNTLPEVVEVGRVASQYRFFHWEVEFPQVYGGPTAGFDVVLGNPPWETVQMTEREFFAGHEQIVGARNAAARKSVIAALEEVDPPLYAGYRNALRAVEGMNHFVRASGLYPLTARGKINTYSLFAELMRSLVDINGQVGCIVPSGIATDATTQFFFRDLVDSNSLVSLHSFENEAFIFPGVHHAFRFCLIVVSGSRSQGVADLVFYARGVADLMDAERHFVLSATDIALLNPNTHTCPAFRWRRDSELTSAIYRRMPILIREGTTDGNPWQASFMQGLFNMASDSGLFFSVATSARVPLYEAKMVHHFNHRWATYAPGGVRNLTDGERMDPSLAVNPRWWVEAHEVDARLKNRWDRQWVVGWRDITGSEKVRTLIASVVPRYGVGGLHLVLPRTNVDKVACLLANLNSFALDYVARQKVSGTHLAFYVMEQLPVVPPTAYDEPCPWFLAESLKHWVQERVVELVYTAWDVEPFARDHGYEGPPFPWDPERRALLRAELDAAFFHAYGLGADDIAYVMETFWVVRDRDEEAYGEYRTKRLILEIFHAFAEAIATGQPYETRLKPPPANRHIAHPARDPSITVRT